MFKIEAITEICLDKSICSKEAIERLDKIKSFDKLRTEGVAVETILGILKTSFSSIKRWKRAYKSNGMIGLESKSRKPKTLRLPMWSPELEKLVLEVRRQFPLWGKNKIAAVIRRDHSKQITGSTAGRIISKFLRQGQIKSVWYHYYGRIRDKKRRIFDGHAKRWQYGMKSHAPGELVQIDHAVIQLDSGVTFRQFTAVDPFTKFASDQAYTQATSKLAADFLEHTKNIFPFKIKSIQVDGGSEFMGDFEQACKSQNIELYVLPPKSPKLNGGVEI
ncbi:MAG: helix-turn-helix domain-containing protein [bacterium]